MAPWTTIFRVVTAFEDHIIAAILRRPGWHRFVGSIRNHVEDYRHGRDPNEPLRPGEATADPDKDNNGGHGFLRHFVDELKNQAKGNPTEVAPPPPPPPGQRETGTRSTPDPFAKYDEERKRGIDSGPR